MRIAAETKKAPTAETGAPFPCGQGLEKDKEPQVSPARWPSADDSLLNSADREWFPKRKMCLSRSPFANLGARNESGTVWSRGVLRH